ncbi:hypothetical protein ACHWQZ_G003760 [Mnemiopsis leidyi]
MILLLVLLSSVTAGPLPEFNLQSGGRVVQREIPTFDGVDWSKSRRGVCYDKTSTKNVAMGQQFYLDCGRCTCDRYGFWCIPKCPLFNNPDMSNCVEIVDIADPCCPRKECLKYKDPTRGPTTDPWDKETMSMFNGIDDLKLKEKTTTILTESVTITVTSEEREKTPESTTQFGGAFTTGSTQEAADIVVTEIEGASSETVSEVLTPASLPVTDDLTTKDLRGFTTTQEITTTQKLTTEKEPTTTPKLTTQKELTTLALSKESTEISGVPVFSTAADESSTSEERSLGYMTGTSDRTRSSNSDRTSSGGSDLTFPPRPLDDTVSGITNSVFTITAETSESKLEVISTGSPGPQSTPPSRETSEELAVTTGKTSEYPTEALSKSTDALSESTEALSESSENPSVSDNPSDLTSRLREEPSPSSEANTESPSTSPDENPSTSERNDPQTSPGFTTAGPSASTNKRSSSRPNPTDAITGTTETIKNISTGKTENSSTRGIVRTELLSTETMTISTTEEAGIQSTPDYY